MRSNRRARHARRGSAVSRRSLLSGRLRGDILPHFRLVDLSLASFREVQSYAGKPAGGIPNGSWLFGPTWASPSSIQTKTALPGSERFHYRKEAITWRTLS